MFITCSRFGYLPLIGASQLDLGVTDQKSKALTSTRNKRALIFAHIEDMNHAVFLLGGPKMLQAIGEDSKCKHWRGAAHPQQLYPPIMFPDAPPSDVGEKKYLFRNLAIAKVRQCDERRRVNHRI